MSIGAGDGLGPAARAGKIVQLGLLGATLLAAGALAAAARAESLTAAQIVERNVSARGGLAAWHGLQTLSMSGKMDAGTGDSRLRSQRIAEGGTGASLRRQHQAALDAAARSNANQQVQLPFTLEMKRPNRSRLEIQFAGKTAVQVYDGTNGWKVRPFLNRNDVEPFTADEARAEASRTDMYGLLIDYAAKGSKVELAGTEPVAGQNAYRLKVTTRGGEVREVWIDSKTFLDVKVEGTPRRMDSKMHRVFVYQRDFKPVQGLVMPYLCETVVDGYPQTHRMVVETISVNKTLADARFSRPEAGQSPPVAAVGALPMVAAAAPAAATAH
jgi:hypothetical protein